MDKFFGIMRTVLKRAEIIEAFEREYAQKYRAGDLSASFSFYLSGDIQAILGVIEEEKTLVPIMDLVYIGGKD